MKKLKSAEKVIVQEAKIVEEEGGLVTLLGKTVLFQCMNYNYIGKLVGVNATCIELEEAKVVFETGPYTSSTMKNAQPVHKNRLFIQTGAIESFWEV